MHQPRSHAKELRLSRPSRLHQICLAPPQQEHVPRKEAKDHKGQPQMRRQPVGGHIQHSVPQPAGHHPPANRALQTAQSTQQQQSRCPSSRNAFRCPEKQEPSAPNQPDHAAQLPMPPFPPVDELELGQAHAFILKLVFWDLPVLVEFALPVRLAHRRQRSGHRRPFGDRKTRIRETGHTTHGDHHSHQSENTHQPEPDRPARATRRTVNTPRRGLRLWLVANILKQLARCLGHQTCS